MNGSSSASTPSEYLDAIEEPRRTDVRKLYDLVRETLPDQAPQMHSGMIGFGVRKYRYASGRETEWFLVGIASQKNYISLYVCAADGESYVAEGYRERLPKASIGKSCVRFKRLSDVDEDALREMLKEAERTGFGGA